MSACIAAIRLMLTSTCRSKFSTCADNAARSRASFEVRRGTCATGRRVLRDLVMPLSDGKDVRAHQVARPVPVLERATDSTLEVIPSLNGCGSPVDGLPVDKGMITGWAKQLRS